MKKSLKIIVLGITLALLSNCSNDDDTSAVNIRLSNISEYSFENIIVNTGNGDVSFENINLNNRAVIKVLQPKGGKKFIKMGLGVYFSESELFPDQ